MTSLEGERPRLYLRTPDGQERPIEVGASPLVFGRGRDVTHPVEDAKVSRRHLEVVREKGAVLARDLGSAGGTRLNGGPLEGTVALAPGDRLAFGDCELRFVLVAAVGTISVPGPSSVLTGDRERDARNVAVLLETIAELHAAEDQEELLARIVDRAIGLAQGSRGALLLERAGKGLEVALARDADGRDLPPGEAITRTIPERARKEGRAVVLTDAAAPEQRSAASASIVSGELGSVLAVPLPSPAGPLGVLYVDSRRPADRFGPAELAFFEALAAQGAVALERARAEEARESLAASARARLEAENRKLREKLGEKDPLGESPALELCLTLARRLAASDLTVLLQGETGSGKEVVARLVHRSSPRREGPFVVVDCGAIPETLVESELFGHEKGAFTGATTATPGRFREASGGTLFLDEIGELPLALQPKLLRVIQERTVTPVGGKTVPVDVRVVAATHRDLEGMVREGTFRQDLYYRLSVAPVAIPPLRERGEDVLLLARAFLSRHAGALGRSLEGFTREAEEAIRAHRWPGNVRELEHVVHRACVLAEPPFVARRDLGLAAAASGDDSTEAPAAPSPFEEKLPFPPLQDARGAATERFEKAYVSEALRRCSGNVTQAAKLAGVSRQLLQRLMKRHGIEREGS